MIFGLFFNSIVTVYKIFRICTITFKDSKEDAIDFNIFLYQKEIKSFSLVSTKCLILRTKKRLEQFFVFLREKSVFFYDKCYIIV